MESTGLLLIKDMIDEYLLDPTEQNKKELLEWITILTTEYSKGGNK